MIFTIKGIFLLVLPSLKDNKDANILYAIFAACNIRVLFHVTFFFLR